MNRRHYASTGIGRSLRQILHGLRSNSAAISRKVSVIAERLRRDETRISRGLHRPMNGLDILIIGPGPYLVEPRFFGMHNAVTAVDLDVIPQGFSPAAYFQMFRQNGAGRLLKTVGRKILGIDRRHARAWQQELQIGTLPEPIIIHGDILKGPPQVNAYDVVACWAVFQHIPDPTLAVKHMQSALRPGGVMYFHVHLYTSNTGHHDIRAFTGGSGELEPWAHLRPSTQGQVTPSAWLNQWRLRDWRSMLEKQAPGYEEFRETYNDTAKSLLTGAIRAELAEFEFEELLTFEVFFMWKKPEV